MLPWASLRRGPMLPTIGSLNSRGPPLESSVPLAFGDFTFDRDRRQLLRRGDPVRLEPKAYDLLGLLLERRPSALSKIQIRDAIWPATPMIAFATFSAVESA